MTSPSLASVTGMPDEESAQQTRLGYVTEDPPPTTVQTTEEKEPLSPWFNVVHLIWLHNKGYIDTLPPELGPYPMMYRAEDERLGTQLRDWGILDEGMALTEQARSLLSALVGAYDWALWGLTIMFAARQRVEVSMPQALIEYGVPFSLRDTPRVPLMICVRKDEVVSALSTAERLYVRRYPRKGDANQQVGLALKELMDPDDQIKTLDMKPITVPATLVAELASDEVSSAGVRPDDTGDERAEASKAVKNRLLKEHMSSTTANELAKLVSEETSVLTQVGIIDESSNGFGAVKGLAMGLLYFGNGLMVSHPEFFPDGSVQIKYRPGNEKAFTEGVASLRRAARKYPRMT